MEDKFKALHKRMSNELAKVLYCLEDLGLLCAYEVFILLSDVIEKKLCLKEKEH